jgi:hypothetical protein
MAAGRENAVHKSGSAAIPGEGHEGTTMTAYLAPNGMNVYRGDAACRRIFVGTTTGIGIIERSDTGTWNLSHKLLEARHISSMLVESKRGGLFVGVHGGGIHFSSDGGKSWEERARGISIPHVYTLAATTENDESVLYAGSEPVSIFRSRDYGLTWE